MSVWHQDITMVAPADLMVAPADLRGAPTGLRGAPAGTRGARARASSEPGYRRRGNLVSRVGLRP